MTRVQRSFVLAIALGLTLVGVGCSNQKANEEMQEQQASMAREEEQWKQELASWESDHDRMKQEQASMPTPKGESAEEAQSHMDKMAKHEQAVADFRKDLESQESKLQEEAGKSEKDRVVDHAALWAEHLKLKAQYEMLENAHKDLAAEHSKMLGKDSTTTGNY